MSVAKKIWPDTTKLITVLNFTLKNKLETVEKPSTSEKKKFQAQTNVIIRLKITF